MASLRQGGTFIAQAIAYRTGDADYHAADRAAGGDVVNYESIDDIVLDCINKGRPMAQGEFWERYERTCKRANVMPLYEQCRQALIRLWKSGRIEMIQGQQKRIRRLA
jgi:hypothetical protein